VSASEALLSFGRARDVAGMALVAALQQTNSRASCDRLAAGERDQRDFEAAPQAWDRRVLNSLDRLVFVALYRLASGVFGRADNSQASNCDRLASCRLSRLLALAIAATRRPAQDAGRDPPADDSQRHTVQGYYTNEQGNTVGAWRVAAA
jgi:hypothetical protein